MEITLLKKMKKIYSIGAYNSCGMLSDNPQAGIYETELCRTLDLNGGNPACYQGGIMILDKEERDTLEDNKDTKRYRVRRLTPTECGRLQGFPSGWCENIEIENPTQEDIDRWREIFAENGKNKSDKQITRFLKNPYSDTAEYKMWGNGMALPCVLYVMEGLAEAGGVERSDAEASDVHSRDDNYSFYSFQRSDELAESDVASTMQARQWKDATDLIVENTPTYCLQGSMIGRKDENGPQGSGINEDECFTLNTIDRHAVVEADNNAK